MTRYDDTQDFNQIPVARLVLEQGTAFPTSPAPIEGQKFYRTDLDAEYVCTDASGPTWTATMATSVSDASTTVKGIVELATDAETITGTDATRAVTPSNLQAKVASSTARGIVELATDAEALTGSDTTRAVTPANLQAKIDALVAAAPGTLDTLNEIAAALGDDPNFAATITAALGTKAAGFAGTSPALTAGAWADVVHSLGKKAKTVEIFTATGEERVVLGVRNKAGSETSTIQIKTDVVGGRASGFYLVYVTA